MSANNLSFFLNILLLLFIALWLGIITLVGVYKLNDVKIHQCNINRDYEPEANDLFLNVKTIMVTGGAGFIGSHMVVTLLEKKKFTLVIVDNLSRSTQLSLRLITDYARKINESENLHVEIADISNYVEMVRLFQMYHVDLVMHFAGNAYVAESVKLPALYYQNITVATSELIRAMQDSSVYNLIYSSTCAVYGHVKTKFISECSVPSPVSPYGLAKWMAENAIEQQVKSQGSKLRAVVLRYFNVVGADVQGRVGPLWVLPEHKLYARLIDNVIESASGGGHGVVDVYGNSHDTKDGTCIRDYIHVNDLVEAHLSAINLLEQHRFSVYNVGLGVGHSVLDVIHAVERVMGVNLNFTFKSARIGDAAKLVGSPRKFLGATNWRPKINSMDVMIKSSLNWNNQVKRLVLPEKIILHFVWVRPYMESESDEFMAPVRALADAWAETIENENYEIMIWNRGLTELHFPELIPVLTRIKTGSWISDILRYYALFKFGGLYLDTDVKPVRDPTVLWVKHNKTFAVCEIPHFSYSGYDLNLNWNFETCKLYASCVVAMPKLHPVLKCATETVLARTNQRLAENGGYQVEQVGPMMWTHCARQFPEIDVLPTWSFLSCPFSETVTNCKKEDYLHLDYVVGFHEWRHSWW